MTTTQSEPHVELAPHLPCLICGAQLLLAVTVPITVEWQKGKPIPARRTMTLCPHCHHDDQNAQGILAFFTLHEHITQETTTQAAILINQWIITTTKTHPQQLKQTDIK